MIQPDLFMRNDQPILDVDFVDISKIEFDFEPTTRFEEGIALGIEYLKGIPEGEILVYKTGFHHPLVDEYPDPIYPALWNVSRNTQIAVMTSREYPSVNLPSKYVTNPRYRSNLRGTVIWILHRILAYCFLPNDDTSVKKNIDHINEDKYDYRLENLQWITASENMAKRTKQKGWRNAK